MLVLNMMCGGITCPALRVIACPAWRGVAWRGVALRCVALRCVACHARRV